MGRCSNAVKQDKQQQQQGEEEAVIKTNKISPYAIRSAG